MPDWSVFAGDLKTYDMQTTVAGISLVKVPNPDSIVFFSVKKADVRELRTMNGGQFPPRYIVGNDFKVGGGISIHYDPIKKEITGSHTIGEVDGKFSLPLMGYGPDTFFETLSEIARRLIPDSPYSATRPQQLVDGFNGVNLKQWPSYTPPAR